jgi:hypothetical protein
MSSCSNREKRAFNPQEIARSLLDGELKKNSGGHSKLRSLRTCGVVGPAEAASEGYDDTQHTPVDTIIASNAILYVILMLQIPATALLRKRSNLISALRKSGSIG